MTVHFHTYYYSFLAQFKYFECNIYTTIYIFLDVLRLRSTTSDVYDFYPHIINISAWLIPHKRNIIIFYSMQVRNYWDYSVLSTRSTIYIYNIYIKYYVPSCCKTSRLQMYQAYMCRLVARAFEALHPVSCCTRYCTSGVRNQIQYDDFNEK